MERTIRWAVVWLVALYGGSAGLVRLYEVLYASNLLRTLLAGGLVVLGLVEIGLAAYGIIKRGWSVAWLIVGLVLIWSAEIVQLIGTSLSVYFLGYISLWTGLGMMPVVMVIVRAMTVIRGLDHFPSTVPRTPSRLGEEGALPVLEYDVHAERDERTRVSFSVYGIWSLAIVVGGLHLLAFPLFVALRKFDPSIIAGATLGFALVLQVALYVVGPGLSLLILHFQKGKWISRSTLGWLMLAAFLPMVMLICNMITRTYAGQMRIPAMGMSLIATIAFPVFVYVLLRPRLRH